MSAAEKLRKLWRLSAAERLRRLSYRVLCWTDEEPGRLSAAERLRRASKLLHRAVDWLCWADEEPGREREALLGVRRVTLRLIALLQRRG